MAGGKWTRRSFLEAVGRVGGGAAMYETMTALGLINVPELFGGPLDLPPDTGKGQSVLILGAGIAGLTAAYELRKGGFTVTVLEATGRPGGRNRTIRRGDTIVEDPLSGAQTKQTCEFEGDDLYFNSGPGRIPYHHTALLHYCRELEVPLEIYVMSSRANLYQTDRAWDGKPQVDRRIANDTRYWIASLLAKAQANPRVRLDENLDKAALLDLLNTFGELKPAYPSRDGILFKPYTPEFERFITDPGEAPPRLQLDDLLESQFWKHKFYQPEEYEWQPTLFQPVGGMDGVVKGFIRKVYDLIEYNRAVSDIRLLDKGVEVTTIDPRTGTERPPMRADWCISTIPFEVLDGIPNNLSQNFKTAVHAVPGAFTCKVGWQANRRFWESDNEIYGGISFTDDPITQIWYPSAGFFGQRGVLTGLYNFDDAAKQYTAWTPDRRLAEAHKAAQKLHPQFGESGVVPIEKGMTIAWKNIKYQRGGWADWTAQNNHYYDTFLQPDGRFWIAGDQVSHLGGWQEGAIRSAHYVMTCMVKPELCVGPVSLSTPRRRPLAANTAG